MLTPPFRVMQDAAEAAPKARPWERGDLWRRLRSFRPATWFCKPAAAGPVECARRGWVNAGQDLLACEVCRRMLRAAEGMVQCHNWFAYRTDPGMHCCNDLGTVRGSVAKYTQ